MKEKLNPHLHGEVSKLLPPFSFIIHFVKVFLLFVSQTDPVLTLSAKKHSLGKSHVSVVNINYPFDQQTNDGHYRLR